VTPVLPGTLCGHRFGGRQPHAVNAGALSAGAGDGANELLLTNSAILWLAFARYGRSCTEPSGSHVVSLITYLNTDQAFLMLSSIDFQVVSAPFLR
jgi:hypothetical protein